MHLTQWHQNENNTNTYDGSMFEQRLARDDMYIMGEWDGSLAKFNEKLVNVKPHQYGFIPQRVIKK